jgi:hypothetical protein
MVRNLCIIEGFAGRLQRRMTKVVLLGFEGEEVEKSLTIL